MLSFFPGIGEQASLRFESYAEPLWWSLMGACSVLCRACTVVCPFIACAGTAIGPTGRPRWATFFESPGRRGRNQRLRRKSLGLRATGRSEPVVNLAAIALVRENRCWDWAIADVASIAVGWLSGR